MGEIVLNAELKSTNNPDRNGDVNAEWLMDSHFYSTFHSETSPAGMLSMMCWGTTASGLGREPECGGH